MSKPFTKGPLCEIKAAAELFPYEFQVYRDGSLIATFDEALNGINRLRFTGNYLDGHYDVLIPSFESINNNGDQIPNNLNDDYELETEDLTNLPSSQLNSDTVLSRYDESIIVTETF